MPRHLSDLPRLPVTLSIYRYGHLYVVQDRDLTILDPHGSRHQVSLDFRPSTWSAHGGQLALYDRYAGVALFSGHRVIAESHEEGRRYSAPYATPMVDGKPLLGGHEALTDEEVNGVLVTHSTAPGRWYLPMQRQDVPAPVIAASVELGHWITFHDNQQHFSTYNGTMGRLMFGEPPKQIVPYLYADQGLLAAGLPDGYLFTPDLGLSWRRRKLSGWGVLTERAVVQVSTDRGIEILEGWW